MIDRAGGSQEAWRWRADNYYVRHQTIHVIEPSDKPPSEDGREVQRVPFGFARALEPPVVRREVEPLLWEGD